MNINCIYHIKGFSILMNSDRKQKIFMLCIVFLVLMHFAPLLRAQEASITSYVDKTRIGLQDNLKLTIEVSSESISGIPEPQLPDVNGLKVAVKSTSSSSSFSVSGARMTSKITKSYIYVMEPEAVGNFLIPPISIQHKGKTYTTEPINITVVEGSMQPPPASSRALSPSEQDTGKLEDNLFVRVEVSKQELYFGEPLVVNYVIYSRYDLSNISYQSEPNYIGFWKEDVFNASRMNFQRTTQKGIPFNKMVLRTILLHPNQSGTLTIPSLSLNVDIIVRARSFWDFDSSRKVTIESEPLTIKVKELPQRGRPEGFTGAVGNFNLNSEISTSSLKAGESFTITLRINGKGNFKHFEIPLFPETSKVRVITPEVETEARVDGEEVMGAKIIRYPAIAVEKGELFLSPLQFSYFDPQKQQYQTISTPAYNLNVAPGDISSVQTGFSQRSISLQGSDINYIIPHSNLKSTKLLGDSLVYWFLWIITFLTIPATLFYRYEIDKQESDVSYVRQKQAGKILSKYLKTATQYAKEKDLRFYTFAGTGLINYLTDILKIPRGSTNEEILGKMTAQNFPQKTIETIKNILNRFNEARFMPGGFTENSITNDYETLKQIITEINTIKRGRKR